MAEHLGQWYVVLTHSGQERAAAAAIESLRANLILSKNKVYQVALPEERKIDQERKQVLRKLLFLNQVFVRMDPDPTVFHRIRKLPSVQGIHGDPNPQPLTFSTEKPEEGLSEQEKFDRLVQGPTDVVPEVVETPLSREKPLPRAVRVGDEVAIIEGPFKGRQGVVRELQHDKVKVSLFFKGHEFPTIVPLSAVVTIEFH